MSESNTFLVRSARHVALHLALKHLEGLEVSPQTRLCELRGAVASAAEAEVQTAYLSLDVDLVAVVEAFLAAKAKEKTAQTRDARSLEALAAWDACGGVRVSAAAPTHATAAAATVLALAATRDGVLATLANKTATLGAGAAPTHSPALAVAVRRDGAEAAVARMDGAVATLALPGLAPRQEFRAHTKYASKVAFSASGNWLLSAGYDWKLVCYWRDSHTGDYSIAHTLTFLGAVESLVCLPGTESFVVGSRNDSNLHVIDMPRDNAPSKEPTRQRCSMNKNGDDWISFTPMDMSVVANDSTPSVSGSVTSWTLAVYTDLPSGKICLYNLSLPQVTEFKTTTSPTTAEAAAAAEPLASLSISSTSVSSRFVLSWIGDCFGVVADSFSRPRCLLLPLGKHLILAATSDDSKIMLYDAISVLMNEEGVAKKLGEISGHEGIIRALCFEQEPEVDGGKSSVSLYSGSFDSTIRKWRIES